MKFASALLVAAAAACASAHNYKIDVPYSVTKWTAGQTVTIKLGISPDGPDDDHVKYAITLYKKNGDEKNMTPVAKIGDLPIDQETYRWNIPADLPTANDYSLGIKGVGDSAVSTFSALFTIENPNVPAAPAAGAPKDPQAAAGSTPAAANATVKAARTTSGASPAAGGSAVALAVALGAAFMAA